MDFKELKEKASLLDQSPSLSGTNSLLVQLCRELERLDPREEINFPPKVATMATDEYEAPIEETEEPVKKKKGRKRKSV